MRARLTRFPTTDCPVDQKSFRQPIDLVEDRYRRRSGRLRMQSAKLFRDSKNQSLVVVSTILISRLELGSKNTTSFIIYPLKVPGFHNITFKIKKKKVSSQSFARVLTIIFDGKFARLYPHFFLSEIVNLQNFIL